MTGVEKRYKHAYEMAVPPNRVSNDLISVRFSARCYAGADPTTAAITTARGQ